MAAFLNLVPGSIPTVSFDTAAEQPADSRATRMAVPIRPIGRPAPKLRSPGRQPPPWLPFAQVFQGNAVGCGCRVRRGRESAWTGVLGVGGMCWGVSLGVDVWLGCVGLMAGRAVGSGGGMQSWDPESVVRVEDVGRPRPGAGRHRMAWCPRRMMRPGRCQDVVSECFGAGFGHGAGEGGVREPGQQCMGEQAHTEPVGVSAETLEG